MVIYMDAAQASLSGGPTLDNVTTNATDKVEQPQVEGGETAQKNLANESGAWVKNPTGTDGKPGSPAGADKPAAGDKKDEKGEDKAGADKKDAPVDASADSHATSGLSLLGLLQQDKQQSPKDQW